MPIVRWFRGPLNRRTVALVAAVLTAGAVGVIAPSPGGAINHNNATFELDGNAVTDHTGTGIPDDWDRVCAQVRSDTTGSLCFQGEGGSPTVTNTNGASSVEWASQPANNGTTFTGGGSKDPLDVSSWAWNQGSGGLPGKDVLLNGFAARYDETSNCAGTESSCNVINFGMDRWDNSGDAQNGFWFFQSAVTLGSSKSGAGQTFNGAHTNGDLLVVSDFSIGGTTSTISAYKWNNTCTAAGKPSASCADTNLELLNTVTNANCATVAGNSPFCGEVNSGTSNAPWSFTDKAGNTSFAQGEFYEGAIDLTKYGLGGECFASTMAESRSSTSTSATLKSFVLGSFGACGSQTTTTPEDSAGNSIANGSISIGLGASQPQVQDKAVVKVTGTSTWSGTVTFNLCGPDDLGGTTGNPTDECLTGGTQIGTPLGVSNSTTGGAVTSSPLATVTKAGTYCWRSVFTAGTASHSAGVPDSSDSSSTECFTVTPVTPTLSTTASGSTLGNPISDSAVLAGTANEPASSVINTTGAHGNAAGGSISFTVYGPDSCSTVAHTFTSQTVAGDGTYGSGNFTPTAVGKYVFVAAYSGDSPNTNPSPTVACASEPAGEAVTVTDTTGVTSQQSWVPNDSATVTSTGGSPLTGTVTFTLYDNGTCAPGALNSFGVPVNQLYTKTVTLNGATSPQTVSTSNTTAITFVGTSNLSWQVVYATTVSNVSGSSTTCTEVSNLTIAN